MPTDTYSGDGAQVDFTITFPYTSQSFVQVKLDGSTLVQGTDYSFFDATTIRFVVAPPSATDNVVLERVTSTTLLVDFTDGAGILEADLDLFTAQMLHIAEERQTANEVAAAISASVLTPSITVSSFMQNVLTQTTENAAQVAFGGSTLGLLLFNAASSAVALQNLGVTAYSQAGIQTGSNEATFKSYFGIDNVTPRPNLCVNGGFNIWQHLQLYTAATSPANDDDTYTADQWILLCESADTVDVSKIAPTADLPAEAEAGIALEVVLNTERFGIFQPIEARVSQPLRSKSVTISFYAKHSSANADIGFNLVSFAGGTADTITSDIVNSWPAAPTAPTPIAAATFPAVDSGDNAPDDIGTSWARHSATFTVPGSADNIGIFIYNRSDHTAGEILSITNVKLEEADAASPYIREDFETALLRCERFFVKSFDPDVAPVENIGSFVGAFLSTTKAEGVSSYRSSISWELPARMVALPNVTTYNPHAAGTAWRSDDDTVDRATANIVAGKSRVTIGSAAESSQLGNYYIHASADARL